MQDNQKCSLPTVSNAMPESKSAIFSFFSGSGFLDLGFEKSGFDIAFVNEIHPPFINAYCYSRQKMGIPEPEFGYVIDSIDSLLSPFGLKNLQHKVELLEKRGVHVGFIGGPPCPDFSVAGKNKGKDGENGRLSRSYVDLICAAKPSFFLFENVKGLWRTIQHRAFYDDLKSQLRAAGYLLTDRLINAIEYGAPQDRDRIILVGIHRTALLNTSITEIELPQLFKWDVALQYPGRSAFNNFDWPSTSGCGDTQSYDNVPKELTIEHWFEKNRVHEHPNGQDFFQPRAGLAKFISVLEGDVSKKSYKRLHRQRYSPTAAYGNNEVHIHPTEARRISVAEALAIQSLPMEFCLPPDMTLTNKFKTVGNGVPFLAAKGLAFTLGNFIREHLREIDSRESSTSNQPATQATLVRIHQRALRDKGSSRQRRIA